MAQRIDGASVATDLHGTGKHGFSDTGTRTIVTADWLNAVQEEIVRLIEAQGLTPSPTDLTQLRQAVAAAREDERSLPIEIFNAASSALEIRRGNTSAEVIAGTDVPPQISLMSHGGTVAESPQAMSSQDILGELSFGGYRNGAYHPGACRILARADGAWTPTSTPTRIQFFASREDLTGSPPDSAMTISSSGALLVNGLDLDQVANRQFRTTLGTPLRPHLSWTVRERELSKLRLLGTNIQEDHYLIRVPAPATLRSVEYQCSYERDASGTGSLTIEGRLYRCAHNSTDPSETFLENAQTHTFNDVSQLPSGNVTKTLVANRSTDQHSFFIGFQSYLSSGATGNAVGTIGVSVKATLDAATLTETWR